jgi:GTP-binding protein YchF
MSLKIGIVGLPNVGKSTLFNALTKQHAPAANFPFTTVDPNVGVVIVPDERVEKLATFFKSEKVVPTAIEFVDIAGLVKGASEGEGLGNKFLSHIREVDAIVEVIRFFPDPNVIHVAGGVNPLEDAETINTELALADLKTCENMLSKAKKDAKGGKTEDILRASALQKFYDALSAGDPARSVELTRAEIDVTKDVKLLTQKPILYVANLDEEQIKDANNIIVQFKQKFVSVVPLSIKIEQELAELPTEEQKIFLAEYGLTHSGMDDLIVAGYKLLGLITFLTTGPDETRAWTVIDGSTAPVAAGKIHTDFEKSFIFAETINWKELLDHGGYAIAREKGLVRNEGKEYVVKDGDVIVFKTGL